MLDENGQPAERTVLFPKSAAKIVNDWDVLGLRGTGSNRYILDDFFVPEDHSIVPLTRWPDAERLSALNGCDARQAPSAGLADISRMYSATSRCCVSLLRNDDHFASRSEFRARHLIPRRQLVRAKRLGRAIRVGGSIQPRP